MKKTSLGSEAHLLNCIDKHFPSLHPRMLLGRGDDCCVLQDLGPLCISTDMFMEDVHFRRHYFTPQDIGWKALAVNVSDMAACGARPVGFSLGLALPPQADMALVNGIFEGMAQLARPLDLPLTGGDLTKAEKLHLCITVFGTSEAPGGALTRGVCLPGDTVFLLGRVGLARAGLALLESHSREEAQALNPQAVAALLRPAPLVQEGLRLAALCRLHSLRLGLMDVSDGLSRDLPRLLAGYGVNLSLTPDQLQGGDDYALVGTCDPAHLGSLMAMLPHAVSLGVVNRGPIRCHHRLVRGGFDHFS